MGSIINAGSDLIAQIEGADGLRQVPFRRPAVKSWWWKGEARHPAIVKAPKRTKKGPKRTKRRK